MSPYIGGLIRSCFTEATRVMMPRCSWTLRRSWKRSSVEKWRPSSRKARFLLVFLQVFDDFHGFERRFRAISSCFCSSSCGRAYRQVVLAETTLEHLEGSWGEVSAILLPPPEAVSKDAQLASPVARRFKTMD